MATKQSQVRLTDADKAKVEAIRERMGLPSASSAIRFAVEKTYRTLMESLIPLTEDQLKELGRRYLASSDHEPWELR